MVWNDLDSLTKRCTDSTFVIRRKRLLITHQAQLFHRHIIVTSLHLSLRLRSHNSHTHEAEKSDVCIKMFSMT